MFKAEEIAKWFLYKNNSEQKQNIASNDEYEVYEGITHLKLQKLLYNAQGLSLAMENEKLFLEPLEAWDHGPVVRDVYDIFCIFGKHQIIIPSTKENNEIISKIEENKKIKNLLELVYENFAIYTAWQLREMSHEKGSPWEQTPKNKEMDTEIIKKYFKERYLTD